LFPSFEQPVDGDPSHRLFPFSPKVRVASLHSSVGRLGQGR